MLQPLNKEQKEAVEHMGSRQVKKVMQELEKLVKRINKKEFDATPGYHCRWCDYRNICEEAV